MNKKLYIKPFSEVVALRLNNQLMGGETIEVRHSEYEPEAKQQQNVGELETPTEAKAGWNSYDVWETWE